MFTYQHVADPRRDRAILIGSLGLLAGIAALAIWLWQSSAYGRYLHHTGGGDAPLVVEVSLFAAGWLLMIVAMMLPTSIPLVVTFAALVRRRPHPARLVGGVLLGYLAMWSAFGVFAYVGDRGVHAAVDALPWLAEHPQLIAAATLAIAGVWQFSPLKYRCLDECRSPLGFVMNRWRGVSPMSEAFRLGVAHGVFCIGCCWSMMLVMFGLGLGSLAWMLALGAVMAVEKNAPWGRRISRPLGFLLILAAVAAVAG
jgi:predicted metal-binding membrane protein